MKVIKNGLLVFLISIVIFLCSLLLLFMFTIFDSNYIINKFSKNNYYELLFDDIRVEMSYYIEQSGFKEDIIDNIFDVSDIENDVNNYIRNIYRGKVTNINTNGIKDRLNKKIDNYIDINHFTITNKGEIDVFVDKMINIYVSKIKILGDKFIFINKIIVKSRVVIFGLINLFIILFILNNYKYLDISLYIDGFLGIGSYLYIINRIDINNLLIYNKIFSKVIIDIINSVFNIYIVVIIIFFIFGLLISIFSKKL